MGVGCLEAKRAIALGVTPKPVCTEKIGMVPLQPSPSAFHFYLGNKAFGWELADGEVNYAQAAKRDH